MIVFVIAVVIIVVMVFVIVSTIGKCQRWNSVYYWKVSTVP